MSIQYPLRTRRILPRNLASRLPARRWRL